MAVQERVDMKSEPGLAVETIVEMAGQSGQKGFRFIHRAAQLRRATSSSNSSSLRQAVVVGRLANSLTVMLKGVIPKFTLAK